MSAAASTAKDGEERGSFLLECFCENSRCLLLVHVSHVRRTWRACDAVALCTLESVFGRLLRRRGRLKLVHVHLRRSAQAVGALRWLGGTLVR